MGDLVGDIQKLADDEVIGYNGTIISYDISESSKKATEQRIISDYKILDRDRQNVLGEPIR